MSEIPKMTCWGTIMMYEVIKIVTDELERQIREREIIELKTNITDREDRYMYNVLFNVRNRITLPVLVIIFYNAESLNDRFRIVEYDPERKIDAEGESYGEFRFPADHPLVFHNILFCFREWLKIASEEPYDQRDAKFQRFLDIKRRFLEATFPSPRKSRSYQERRHGKSQEAT